MASSLHDCCFGGPQPASRGKTKLRTTNCTSRGGLSSDVAQAPSDAGRLLKEPLQKDVAWGVEFVLFLAKCFYPLGISTKSMIIKFKVESANLFFTRTCRMRMKLLTSRFPKGLQAAVFKAAPAFASCQPPPASQLSTPEKRILRQSKVARASMAGFLMQLPGCWFQFVDLF